MPLGREVRDSGLAIPLVLLVFGSIWLFPLITALVAGDIVAAEDSGGTLKTILTRSVDRGQIFAGKLLAALSYTTLALVDDGHGRVVGGHRRVGLASADLALGHDGLGAARAGCSPFASLAIYLIPLAAITCIGVLLSTVTRNSAGAVVGTLLVALLFQLIQILPGLGGLSPYLLTTQFDAWHGLLRTPDRLGADGPRALGLRRLRRAGDHRRGAGVPAPRRRQVARRPASTQNLIVP